MNIGSSTLFILLLLFSSICRGGELLISDLDEVIDGLNVNYISSEDARSCGQDYGAVDGYSKNPIEVTSQLRCEDLFSTRPPLWAGISKKAGIFKDPSNWIPVCSPYFIQLGKSLTPDRHLALKVASDKHVSLNSCLDDLPRKIQSADAKLNRYSSTYRPPSQRSSHVRPMKKTELSKVLARFHTLRSEVGDSCCGKDKECLNSMLKIKPYLCKPNSNPDASDPCLNGATLNFPPEYKRWQTWALTTKKFISEFRNKAKEMPVMIGTVIFSPFVELSSDGFDSQYTGDVTFTHELAHGCSLIKRSLMIRRGNVDAMMRFLQTGTSSKEACDFGLRTKKVYEDLYSSLGISKDSQSCLVPLAASARKGKFGVTCSNACPLSHVEEQYATVMSIKMIASKNIKHTIEPICSGIFDDMHGFSSDSLKCVLKTDSVINSIKASSRCRK